MRGLAVRLTVFALMAFAASAQAQKTVYIAFGDSITAGDFDSDTSQPGYPPKLQKLLNDAGENTAVENYGLGGEQTPDGVTRIDSALSLGNGDVLLLMEGTNDIQHGISVETTVQNLDIMSNKASNRGIPTVLATVIPRRPDAKFDSSNTTTRLLNMGIRQLALDRARKLVDPFEVFLEQSSLFDTYYDTDPGDPVGHPNDDGYHLLAQIFADVLLGDDTVPPVALLLDPPDESLNVSPEAKITLRLADFGDGIDLSSLELLLNGQPVDAKRFGGEGVASLQYTDPEGLKGVYSVSYTASDLAATPNTVTRKVGSFTVEGTTFLRGDLDHDGRVDGYDLVLLGSRFGGRAGADSLYYVGFDINGDGVLDGEDLAILANNFGKSSF